MSMTNFNSRQAIPGLALLSQLMSNPTSRNQLMNAASWAGNQLGQAVRGGSSVGFPTGSPITSAANVAGRGPRPRKGKSSRTARTRSIQNPSRALAYRPRMTIKFNAPLVTNASGNMNYSFWLGYKNSNASTDLVTLSATQYLSLSTIFRWQTMHGIKVRFIPYVAYTASGIISTCFQPDPTSVPSFTLTQHVVEKEVFGSSDIKESHSWAWRPQDDQQREAKQSSDASAVSGAALRDYSPGYIGLAAFTNIVSLPLGNLSVEIDVTFSGML